MARRVFYSFHYDADKDRVAQVRNMGVVEGSPIASDNDWEAIKRGGDSAIKTWIDRQMTGTSCCVVLIGSATAGRRWVTYEIETAWRQGKGVVGVHIYELKSLRGEKASRGADPLDYAATAHGYRVSSYARTYDPPFVDSKAVYAHISTNLSNWIEEAIRIRAQYQ
jgi:hypothetical protein